MCQLRLCVSGNLWLTPTLCLCAHAAGPTLSSSCYSPLNPIKQPQPPTVDIWPGRSGTLVFNADTWNGLLLRTPTPTQNKALYDQGRADAQAYAASAFAGTFIPQQLSNALAATAVNTLGTVW